MVHIITFWKGTGPVTGIVPFSVCTVCASDLLNFSSGKKHINDSSCVVKSYVFFISFFKNLLKWNPNSKWNAFHLVERTRLMLKNRDASLYCDIMINKLFWKYLPMKLESSERRPLHRRQILVNKYSSASVCGFYSNVLQYTVCTEYMYVYIAHCHLYKSVSM